MWCRALNPNSGVVIPCALCQRGRRFFPRGREEGLALGVRPCSLFLYYECAFKIRVSLLQIARRIVLDACSFFNTFPSTFFLWCAFHSSKSYTYICSILFLKSVMLCAISFCLPLFLQNAHLFLLLYKLGRPRKTLKNYPMIISFGRRWFRVIPSVIG